MEKKIFYDKNALGELLRFNSEVQKEFQAYLVLLASGGKLEFPEARKITKRLFEIRVTQGGAYRGFYAYLRESYIVILHFFQKKTQKTPEKEIELAEQRLKKYE
ncbi:MAG: type II toxin-antitoxin system RelE/ParE family toxin [Parcubacteria group bacterium]|nr:type II toxin-antitoxin system RelE/ParE family toxin [Parcubacteria group bacterium]